MIALAGVGKLSKKFDPHFELAVNIELPVLDGFRVRRPYVAVWLEDSEGRSVRTLGLWMQLNRKGPKYLPDLRRWFRDEFARRTTDGGDLSTTLSSATREAGKYSFVWDGKDDKGKLVDQGEYTLCIEAARQHGTYQLISQKLTVESHSFQVTLPNNIEVKDATVEFRKRK